MIGPIGRHGKLLSLAVSVATLLSVTVPCIAARAQAGPPVRLLGPVVARSSVTFGAVSQLVPLSDGRTLVSDASHRVVLLLDSSLANPRVVLDSVAGRQNSFSASSFLISFRGDSALFFDAYPAVFVVIGPDGAIGRVMPSPPTGSTIPLWNSARTFGLPMVSPTLGLMYMIPASAPEPAPPPAGQPDIVTRSTDSSFVFRMNLTTRVVDTLTRISNGNSSIITTRADGRSSYGPGFAPFSFFDRAVVVSDGSLAIFRARDYRLEWIASDGVRSLGSRIPFPWRPITDPDRRRMLDSINSERTRQYDSALAKRAADSARTGGAPMTTSRGGRVPLPPPSPPVLAVPEEIPDFYPPTLKNAVMADGDNHVWICPRPATSVPGGAVWDVVNRQGELIDRVRLPDGRTIAGFAPGGVVYLSAVDAGVATLEKARFK